MAEQKRAIALKDALNFADLRKGIMSFVMGTDTPTACLACRRLTPDLKCGAGLDMNAVGRRSMWESGPDTPLTDICPQFDSNRVGQ